MENIVPNKINQSVNNDPFVNAPPQPVMGKPVKKNVKLVWIVSLVTFLLLCMGVFVIYINKVITNEKPISPSPFPTQPTAKPTLTNNILSDWKKYTNDSYHYSIKYPNNWFFYDEKELYADVVLDDPRKTVIISPYKIDKFSPGDISFRDALSVQGNSSNSSLEELKNIVDKKVWKVEDIQIGGMPAVKVTEIKESIMSNPETIYSIPFYGHTIVISHDNTDYKGTHNQIFDEIISSISFVEESVIINNQKILLGSTFNFNPSKSQVEDAMNLECIGDMKAKLTSIEERSVTIEALEEQKLNGKYYPVNPPEILNIIGEDTSCLQANSLCKGVDYQYCFRRDISDGTAKYSYKIRKKSIIPTSVPIPGYSSYVFKMDKPDINEAKRIIIDSLVKEFKACDCVSKDYPKALPNGIKLSDDECDFIGFLGGPTSLGSWVYVYLIPDTIFSKVNDGSIRLFVGDVGMCFSDSPLYPALWGKYYSRRNVIEKAFKNVGIVGYEKYD